MSIRAKYLDYYEYIMFMVYSESYLDRELSVLSPDEHRALKNYVNDLMDAMKDMSETRFPWYNPGYSLPWFHNPKLRSYYNRVRHATGHCSRATDITSYCEEPVSNCATGGVCRFNSDLPNTDRYTQRILALMYGSVGFLWAMYSGYQTPAKYFYRTDIPYYIYPYDEFDRSVALMSGLEKIQFTGPDNVLEANRIIIPTTCFRILCGSLVDPDGGVEYCETNIMVMLPYTTSASVEIGKIEENDAIDMEEG